MNNYRPLIRKNPGPWVEHSRSVAENARRIAEHTDCIDPDTAYTMGLLHDIGRVAGVSGIRHIFDGYDRMIALGQPKIGLDNDTFENTRKSMFFEQRTSRYCTKN